MSRSLAVLDLVRDGDTLESVGLLEPTPADVARWLDQHPELHFAVLGAVRVAHTWGASLGVVTLEHPLTRQTIAAGCRGLDGDPEAWRWWAGIGADRVEGTASSPSEVRAFIRQALSLRGWTVP